MSYRNSSDRCRRIGCTRRRTGRNLDRDCCGPSCEYAYRLHNEAQAIVEHLGHSDPADEYLVATLEIGRSLDRAHKARVTLRRLASEAKWSNEQWDNLIRGQANTAGVPQVRDVGFDDRSTG